MLETDVGQGEIREDITNDALVIARHIYHLFS